MLISIEIPNERRLKTREAGSEAKTVSNNGRIYIIYMYIYVYVYKCKYYTGDYIASLSGRVLFYTFLFIIEREMK